MVPATLNDWTYEVVHALCVAGQPESDRHDFKFGISDVKNTTKLCCAFANTFGGFIVIGVREGDRNKFDIVGIEPNKELYGTIIAKIRADPDISILPPKIIAIGGSEKVLYILSVPQSPRRPHLPSAADQRIFWKRQGSHCIQMTLEEIRYQMNTYEEKREKLMLLLMDLRAKAIMLETQSKFEDGAYDSNIFSFEIIDRIVVESFSLIKQDLNIVGALDTIKSRLMNLNGEKQKLLNILGQSYPDRFKIAAIVAYRRDVRNTLPGVTVLFEQIRDSLKRNVGIEDPYVSS